MFFSCAMISGRFYFKTLSTGEVMSAQRINSACFVAAERALIGKSVGAATLVSYAITYCGEFLTTKSTG